MRVTRRFFCGGVLGYAAARCFRAEAWGVPPQQFPTEPRRRIAVATYPFRALIEAPGNGDRDTSKPGMDLGSFAVFVREHFQVTGIEPLHSHFPSAELNDVRRLRSAFERAGVHTVNVPVDAEVDLCARDAATRNAGVAVYRHWIDIAQILGAPSIRISLPKCGPETQPGELLQRLQPVVSYASSKSILLNFENDDPVYNSAARIVSVLQQAHTPYLRALPDFANSLMGGDQQFNAHAVAQMFAYASNIAHVKDAEIIRKKRETVSLPELFQLAKRSGYRGFYSMESDSGVDPVEDTRHLIEQTVALC